MSRMLPAGRVGGGAIVGCGGASSYQLVIHMFLVTFLAASGLLIKAYTPEALADQVTALPGAEKVCIGCFFACNSQLTLLLVGYHL